MSDDWLEGAAVRLLVLPGDGIGPEITDATLEVLRAVDDAFGLGLEIEIEDIGFPSLEREGTTLPQRVMDRIPEVDGVVLGPVSHYSYPPQAEGGINQSAELRVHFELFANVRPCRSRADLSILRSPMDLVIVRENTEDLYAGLEHVVVPGVVESLKIITEKASTRIARFAFEHARRNRRKRVTQRRGGAS